MRLLAIDTALEACAVGIANDDAPAVIVTETVGRGHAERLFGMLQGAMDEAGLAFADLERIAVTVGPGSFTGLRVGIATARGLALAVECPVIGVGTLSVHAARARDLAGARQVLALLDARRDELYGQAFAAGGSPMSEPEVASAAAFAARLSPGMVLAGSGADLVLAAHAGPGRYDVAHRESAPDMATLLRLALAAPPPEDAPRPLYLRAPDARPQSGNLAVAR
jgi:tRNA threonylcarbamoyladenosine biosynthesis protein TsaB